MFWFFAKFAFCSSRSTRSCLQAVMDSFLSRMFWMFSWTSRLNQKPLFLEFSGFYILFSFQGSLLLSHRQLIYIIISDWLCQQLFYFIFNLSQKPVCVSALISSIDLPLSQGRMLWYQSFQVLSTIFLYLLFFLFCCDFLEYFVIYIYFTHTRLKNQQHSHQLILILLAEMPLIYFAPFSSIIIYTTICSLLFPNTTVTRLRCAIFQNCT